MSQVRFRQVARLEKRALFYIEQKRRYEEEERVRSASDRERYFVKIANLSLLILYGDPKIGEPVTCAWQRCLESRAWKECREKHPDRFGISGGEVEGPFDDRGAQCIAQYFHEYILPDLPGADDIEKLNSVFAKAPAWLLWFTNAELTVLFLGLKLPDLSSMFRFARPRGRRDYLPYGAFELRRLPDGEEDRILPLIREQLAIEAKLTPRERMRAVRIKESSAMSGSGGDSSQSRTDDRSDGDAVAAWLRRMSQVSGAVAAWRRMSQG